MELHRIDPANLPCWRGPCRVACRAGGVIAVRMPNWLGDAVMALPALRQLRCGGWRRIVAVAPAPVSGLLELTTAVDGVIVLPAAHCSWPGSAVDRLRAEGADCGLLLTNSPRDVIYFRRAGVGRLYGSAARGRSILMTAAYKFPHNHRGRTGILHHARKYSFLAEAVGGSGWDGEFPGYRLPESVIAAELSGDPLLVLAPGAAYGAAKRWPSNSFANTALRFLEDYRAGTVVIVGSKSESVICGEVADGIGHSDRVRNLCGRTALADLAAVLCRADYCIANDSGIMHLSASLGGAGLAVFGSTDYVSTAPLSSKWGVIYSAWGHCAPCFRRRCILSDEPLCMRAVNSGYVYNEMRKAIKEA